MRLKWQLLIIFGGLLGFWHLQPAFAQVASQQIIFNSFTGTYYLSRDSRGLSLLTTQETIVADFGGSGFYGITRDIPEEFQGHSVSVKITSVTDAAGNNIPYKTKTDANRNLVVTTGDPSISLYGSQTIKLSYQTSGVINLSQNSDQFVLDVNGRGWSSSFGKVDATLTIPSIFNAQLAISPTCYTALNSSISTQACQINTRKSASNTIVTAKAGPLNPHQTLILKMAFKPATFTNPKKSFWSSSWLIVSVAALILVILGGWWRFKR